MSGSSLESDLRAAREARGLSLDDIQAETRIPVHILKQFEEGRLVGDPTYNEVYLRAFLKSYAKSVGLSQSEVLTSYDQSRGRSAPPPPPEAPRREPPADPPKKATVPPPSEPKRSAEPTPDAPAPVSMASAATSSSPAPGAATRPPAVAAASASKPSMASAATAPTARVRKPPVPSAKHSFDKNWGTIIGLFVVVLAVLGAAVWFLVIRDDGEVETSPVATQGGGNEVAAIDSVGVGAGSGTSAPQMQTPITVTLYAGGNGLQNFRVTEEPNERLGHWIEAGDSKTYTSPEAIVLWGEGGDGFGDDAVVELQGQRWSPTGTTPIRIDAANGQRLLDSLAARPPGTIPAIPGGPAPTGE